VNGAHAGQNYDNACFLAQLDDDQQQQPPAREG
jgi:hypothetical protein